MNKDQILVSVLCIIGAIVFISWWIIISIHLYREVSEMDELSKKYKKRMGK